MKLIAERDAQDEIARYLRKVADEIESGVISVDDLTWKRETEEIVGDGPFREIRPSGVEKLKLRITRHA